MQGRTRTKIIYVMLYTMFALEMMFAEELLSLFFIGGHGRRVYVTLSSQKSPEYLSAAVSAL